MTSYDKLSKYYANQREKMLREFLARDYGSGKYRITKKDEIHVYGTMPNTNQTGWWLKGFRLDVEREYNLS